MEDLKVAGIATSGGDHIRIRMMHYAVDDEFNVYLSSMKGDPKIAQLTINSSVSLFYYIYIETARVNLYLLFFFHASLEKRSASRTIFTLALKSTLT